MLNTFLWKITFFPLCYISGQSAAPIFQKHWSGSFLCFVWTLQFESCDRAFLCYSPFNDDLLSLFQLSSIGGNENGARSSGVFGDTVRRIASNMKALFFDETKAKKKDEKEVRKHNEVGFQVSQVFSFLMDHSNTSPTRIIRIVWHNLCNCVMIIDQCHTISLVSSHPLL